MKDILCSVDVSIMMTAAGRASPLSDVEILYFRIFVSAYAAKLTGGIHPIYLDKSASSCRHLCSHR